MNDVKLAGWLFLVIIVLSLILSCSEGTEICLGNQGSLLVTNESEDRHEVYLGTLVIADIDAGGTTLIEEVSIGTYKVVTLNLRTGSSAVITDFQILPCETVLLPIIF